MAIRFRFRFRFRPNHSNPVPVPVQVPVPVPVPARIPNPVAHWRRGPESSPKVSPMTRGTCGALSSKLILQKNGGGGTPAPPPLTIPADSNIDNDHVDEYYTLTGFKEGGLLANFSLEYYTN